ncbi:3-keto-disaccharide hydrolase [Pedobacter sp. P26]|uniref:3-keto-disaccharide hydrolase n=1 Tax=Pedobacter sp. P26 TaxID=3423956 RepID=UPI003D66659D
MKNYRLFYMLLLSIFAVNLTYAQNTLSKIEKKDGFKMLWNGKDATGWRAIFKEQFPAKGWEMKDGVLTVLASNGQEQGSGGDIVTRDEFSAFILKFDFKLSPGANSGIKYFVTEEEKPTYRALVSSFRYWMMKSIRMLNWAKTVTANWPLCTISFHPTNPLR